MSKGILGGFMYAVMPSDSGTRVIKISPDGGIGEESPEYLVVDGVCSCPASSFGNECKHVRMADGTLVGKSPSTRAEAHDVLLSFFDKVRESFPGSQSVSLVNCRPPGPVDVATGLAFNVLSDMAPARMTLWSEPKGILVRIHCFREHRDYRAALRRARAATQSHASPPAGEREEV